MRKLLTTMAICLLTVTCFSSCVTTKAVDISYHPYDLERNLVVENDICYVYYTNPTTLFLNSLYVIDGAYYYWYIDKYIPVVFPCWEVWSPYRFFYYDKNRWMWRDRCRYNHMEYRKNQHWRDYRKLSIQPRPNIRTHRPNHNIRPTKPTTRPRINNHTLPNRHDLSPVPSSTRITVNHGSFNGGNKTSARRKR